MSLHRFLVSRHVILIIILHSANCGAQIIYPGPLNFFSQLNCYSRQFANPFSMEGNAASICLVPKAMVGVACKNRYLVANLNQYAIGAVIPTSKGNFGLHIQSFHYGDFAEWKPSLAFSKKLGQIFLGVQFHYHMVRIAAYGSNSALIPEIGTVWRIRENLCTGVTISRPIWIEKSGSQETFAYNYSSGIGYEVSDQVLLAASIRLQEDQSSQLNLGLQYQFSEQFFAAIGINCANAEVNGAAGWKWKSLKIETMFSYHPKLGCSPGLVLQYDLDNTITSQK